MMHSLIKSQESEGKVITRIAKNTIFSLLAIAIDICVSLLSISLIARYLGVNSFGEYIFVITFVEFMSSFFYSGLELILAREIAKKKEEAENKFGGALLARWIMSLVGAMVIIILTIVINVPEIVKIAIVISTISRITFSNGNLFIVVFKAFERMEYETLISLVYRLSFLAAVLIVISLKLGFISLFVGIVIVNLIRTLLSKSIVKNKFFKPHLKAGDFIIAKHFLKESFILGLAVITFFGIARIDILLLKLLRNSEEVGIFNAAYTLILSLQFLPVAFVGAVFPIFSRYAASSKESLLVAYKKALRFILFFAIPLSAIVFFLSDDIINILYENEFKLAVIPLKILIFGSIFSFLNALFDHALIATNNQKLVTVSNALCFITNIILDLLLIPKYGYIGACIGTVGAYTVLGGVGIFFIYKKLGIFSFDVSTFWLFVAGAIMILFLYASRNFWKPATVIGSLIIYIIAVLLLRVFPREDIFVFKRGLRLS